MKAQISIKLIGLFIVLGILASCGAGGKASCDAYGQSQIKQNTDLSSK
ncbi:MAG: hypothetical protein ACKO6A_04555 [Bacteroidota bacterium]